MLHQIIDTLDTLLRDLGSNSMRGCHLKEYLWPQIYVSLQCVVRVKSTRTSDWIFLCRSCTLNREDLCLFTRDEMYRTVSYRKNDMALYKKKTTFEENDDTLQCDTDSWTIFFWSLKLTEIFNYQRFFVNLLMSTLQCQPFSVSLLMSTLFF